MLQCLFPIQTERINSLLTQGSMSLLKMTGGSTIVEKCYSKQTMHSTMHSTCLSQIQAFFLNKAIYNPRFGLFELDLSKVTIRGRFSEKTLMRIFERGLRLNLTCLGQFTIAIYEYLILHGAIIQSDLLTTYFYSFAILSFCF